MNNRSCPESRRLFPREQDPAACAGERLEQAQLQHDSKALDRLLAGTFISTDNDGTFMTKAQFLADNSDLSYAASLMTNSDEQVFLYENAAVVAGSYHAKGSHKGKPSDHYG